MTPRYFGIVPAAGHSTRMGRPKLLLPWGAGTLIAATIQAWRQSRVHNVLAVVRSDDVELAAACGQAGAIVVTPEAPPPDMKASIQAALRHIEQSCQPTEDDAFLVAPADMPCLSPAIIERLIEARRQGDDSDIFAPTLAEKRGHPVLLPWSLAHAVWQLQADEGLNMLVERGPLQLVPCDDLVQPADRPFLDVDTPEDYRRLG